MPARESPTKPKRNARRVLEQIERLRAPGEGPASHWLRCTLGFRKSQGGDGVTPGVLAITDVAYYVGRGGRWVDVLRTPFGSIEGVATRPFTPNLVVLDVTGKRRMVEFTVCSSERAEVMRFEEFASHQFETTPPPVIDTTEANWSLIERLAIRVSAATTADRDRTSPGSDD